MSGISTKQFVFLFYKTIKMKLEQIYTGCLAQGAYYIESDGEAAVIDPLREPTPYLERADDDGAEIKYIFRRFGFLST